MRCELPTPVVSGVPEGGAGGNVVGYYDEFGSVGERVGEEGGCGGPDVEGVGAIEKGDGVGERPAFEVDAGEREGSVGGYGAGGELGEA